MLIDAGFRSDAFSLINDALKPCAKLRHMPKFVKYLKRLPKQSERIIDANDANGTAAPRLGCRHLYPRAEHTRRPLEQYDRSFGYTVVSAAS